MENVSIALPQGKGQGMSLAAESSDSIFPSASWDPSSCPTGSSWHLCMATCKHKSRDCAQGHLEAGWLLSGTDPQLGLEHPPSCPLPLVYPKVSGLTLFLQAGTAKPQTCQAYWAGCVSGLIQCEIARVGHVCLK